MESGDVGLHVRRWRYRLPTATLCNPYRDEELRGRPVCDTLRGRVDTRV